VELSDKSKNVIAHALGQPVDYLVVFLRLVTVMAITMAVILMVMGRRPIGELPVFDFIVIIVPGSVIEAH